MSSLDRSDLGLTIEQYEDCIDVVAELLLKMRGTLIERMKSGGPRTAGFTLSERQAEAVINDYCDFMSRRDDD
ncbi:MAG TPA: hypothetical protein VF329_03415 [Gammaproteobacteria bacterium]